MAEPRTLADRLAFAPSRAVAIAVLVASLALTGLAIAYAANHLDVDTDPMTLLSPELPVRKTHERLQEHFPFHKRLILVVDALSPEAASAAANDLATQLRQRSETFRRVEVPGEQPFFQQNGLLFRSEEDLKFLSARLVQSQPLLNRLAQEPTLPRLFDTLTMAGTMQAEQQTVPLRRLSERLAEHITEHVEQQPGQLSWSTLLSPEDPDRHVRDGRQLVIAYPRLDYGQVFAGRQAMEAARAAGKELGLNTPGHPRLRITGNVAMAHEELVTVKEGMGWLGTLAFALVALALFVAMRSVGLMLATMVTLLVGLVLTAGFAGLSVGRLNLISVAFAVLYVGLGADFVIHYVLRYREKLRQGFSKAEAVRVTGRDTEQPLALCALTTAMGFLAFVPTAYLGVAELGIIAGFGMFVSLVSTLVLLPALLQLLPPPRPAPASRTMPPSLVYLLGAPQRHRRVVAGVGVVVFLAAFAFVPGLRFDPDPLSLRDPESESVATLEDLSATHEGGHWAVSVLSPDLQASQKLVAELKAEPDVARVISVHSFVPENQDAKLAIIDDLVMVLGILPQPPEPQAASAEARQTAIDALHAAATEAAAEDEQAPLQPLAQPLSELRGQLAALPPDEREDSLDALRIRLLGTLPPLISRLDTALNAQRITLENLPADLKDQWLDDTGVCRVQAYPDAALEEPAELRRFVNAIQAHAPGVTGPAVFQVESSDAIIRSFAQATLTALAAICLVLWIRMRHLGMLLVVLTPLVVGGLTTGAVMVLIGENLNFANVIALPLLLGIGVDSGIHMVERRRAGLPEHGNLLATATARAVLFSSLTTLFSFGTLWLSPHPGTSSMGRVLSIGLIAIVVCTLVLVPALLVGRKEASTNAKPNG